MEDVYSDTEVYHPLAMLGEGTFGKVLQCWRASDGELVALKVLPTGAHMRSLITNELRLTAALDRSDMDSSHIVRFFESFRHHTEHYLVLEMLEKNLYELQRENGFRPLPVRHVRTVGSQLLRALVKLKEMGIIHADIKPENIMTVDQLRFPFRVKLVDFGSASFLREVHFIKQPYIQSRFYRSPEILLGLPFSEKVDMWSLGCVMAELYLGWPLYPGGSEFEQVRYICETQGLPCPHLLNRATKTSLFFKRTETLHEWQLKPSTGPNGGQTEGMASVIPDRRKYILRSLDQLYSVHGPEQDEAFGQEDTVAEFVDRRCMVELIKRMLTIDPLRRIKPKAALTHPFITLTHLHGSMTQRYYDVSLQELQKALISRRSSHGSNPTLELQNPPPSCEDQHMRFPAELNNQEVSIHQSPEGDGDQPHCDGPNLIHDPCCGLQLVRTYKLNQLQSITEKMEKLTIACAGCQKNSQAGRFGDAATRPVQNASVASELQARPLSVEAEQNLVNVPLKCPEIASMLTPLNTATRAIKQLSARPYRYDHTSHLHSSLQVHAGNSSFLASTGVSQVTLFTPPLLSPPGEPCDPPQLFTPKTHQDLSVQGQKLCSCSEQERDVCGVDPYEGGSSCTLSVQWPAVVDSPHCNTFTCTAESGATLLDGELVDL